jgi:hypothetical protein
MGNVTFEYKIIDSLVPGGFAIAKVTLVYPSPGGPTAADDAYRCPFNAPCSPSVAGVMGNDRSLTGGPLTVVKVLTQPAVGTLNFTLPSSGGLFEFTPPT